MFYFDGQVFDQLASRYSFGKFWSIYGLWITYVERAGNSFLSLINLPILNDKYNNISKANILHLGN